MAAKWQGSGDTARSGKCQWLPIIFKYHNVLREVLGKSAEYMPTKEARNKKISYIRITTKKESTTSFGEKVLFGPRCGLPLFRCFYFSFLKRRPPVMGFSGLALLLETGKNASQLPTISSFACLEYSSLTSQSPARIRLPS